MTRYVIEYVCPVDGIDYDVELGDFYPGVFLICPGCGGLHAAGVDMQANVLDADGAFVTAYEVKR